MNISFSLTTRQIRQRSKTVTRRLGWKNLKAGQVLMACEKCQGLKKGEHPVKLGEIRVVNVRRERLDEIAACDPWQGALEVQREGFGEMTPAEFVAFFCQHNGCEPEVIVTRIEFEYL